MMESLMQEAEEKTSFRQNMVNERRKAQAKHGRGQSNCRQWRSREEAWKVSLQQEKKVIFDRITIAEDGGIDDVSSKSSELWSNTRYFSALLSIVFILYNTFYIFYVDIRIFLGLVTTTTNAGEEGFLILTTILPLQGYSSSKIIAMIELSWLTWLIGFALFRAFQVLTNQDHARWIAVCELCFVRLPTISAFSAIKLLEYIVPQIITYDLFYILFYTPGGRSWGALAWFFVSRPLTFCLGVDCFLVKFRATSQYVDTADFSWNALLPSLLFLRQVISVVTLSKVISDRLFRFAFGGEDGVMTPREIVRMETWQALIAKEIYQVYPLSKAIALLLTFSDSDFQLLIIQEDLGHGDPDDIEAEHSAFDRMAQDDEEPGFFSKMFGS